MVTVRLLAVTVLGVKLGCWSVRVTHKMGLGFTRIYSDLVGCAGDGWRGSEVWALKFETKFDSQVSPLLPPTLPARAVPPVPSTGLLGNLARWSRPKPVTRRPKADDESRVTNAAIKKRVSYNLENRFSRPYIRPSLARTAFCARFLNAQNGGV
jgi:hypothetical protein